MVRPGVYRFVVAIAAAIFAWPSTGGAERVRCGPNDCAADESCCNYGCGICVPKDGNSGCIQPLCFWGRPVAIAPVDRPSVDTNDRVHGHLTWAQLFWDDERIRNLTS